VSWGGWFPDPIVLYRQVLPRDGFEGSAARVPVYDPDLPLEGQQAQEFMGAYAPAGQTCSAAAFLAGDSCGLPVT
jgi:hypothetical protein